MHVRLGFHKHRQVYHLMCNYYQPKPGLSTLSQRHSRSLSPSWAYSARHFQATLGCVTKTVSRSRCCASNHLSSSARVVSTTALRQRRGCFHNSNATSRLFPPVLSGNARAVSTHTLKQSQGCLHNSQLTSWLSGSTRTLRQSQACLHQLSQAASGLSVASNTFRQRQACFHQPSQATLQACFPCAGGAAHPDPGGLAGRAAAPGPAGASRGGGTAAPQRSR